MASPISILLHDAANRIKLGAGAPLKNQTLHLPPSRITLTIDSNSPGFQAAMLGSSNINLANEKRARLARKALRSNANVITSSDFDLHIKPVASDPTVKRILKMLAAGQTWQEAGFHDWMMAEINANGSLDGCRTKVDVIRRYERLDALKEQIRSGDTLHAPASTFGRYGKIDGVIVAIGREGEIIFCGSGKHRLALAIGLEVPSLPVSVCAVHGQAVENGKWHALLDSQVVAQP